MVNEQLLIIKETSLDSQKNQQIGDTGESNSEMFPLCNGIHPNSPRRYTPPLEDFCLTSYMHGARMQVRKRLQLLLWQVYGARQHPVVKELEARS